MKDRATPAQSLTSGAIAMTVPVLSAGAANIIAAPFILSKIGIHNFGLWSLTLGIAQYAVLFDLGVSRAVLRFAALYHAQGDKQNERATLGCSALFVLALAGSLLMAISLMPEQLAHLLHTNDSGLAHRLFAMSIVVLITGLLGNILSSAAVGRGRMVAASIGSAFQRVGVTLGGVIALASHPNLEQLAFGSAIGGSAGLLFVACAIFIDEREIGIGPPNSRVLIQLVKFGLKSQAAAIADIVLFQSGKVLAGLIVGPAAAGIYDLSSRLTLGGKSVSGAVNGAISGHLTRLHAVENTEQIHQDYPRLLRGNALAGCFVMFLLFATASTLVPLWLGRPYPQVVLFVVTLCPAIALNNASGVASGLAYASNRLGLVLISLAFAIALFLIIQVPLAFLAGLEGIAVGAALVTASSAIFAALLIQRRSDIPASTFFRAISGPFAVALVAAGAAIPIGLLSAPVDRVSAVVPFCASALLFCGLFILLSWRLGYLPVRR